MKRFLISAIITLFLSGCYQGLLYTHVREPYFKNIANNTPVAEECYNGNMKELSDPVFTSLKVKWGSLSAIDVMQRNNLLTSSIIDIERRSILFGLWRKDTVWVCSNDKPE